MMERPEVREERKLILEYLKTVFSTASIVAIIFAAYQWYHTNKIYRDDLDNKMVAVWMENVKMLADKPLISRHFVSSDQKHDDKSNISENYDSSAIAFADLRLEVIDHILNNLDNWSIDDIATWKVTFLNAFRQSKILCTRFKELRFNFDNISTDLSGEQIRKDIDNNKQEREVHFKRFDGIRHGVDGICNVS